MQLQARTQPASAPTHLGQREAANVGERVDARQQVMVPLGPQLEHSPAKKVVLHSHLRNEGHTPATKQIRRLRTLWDNAAWAATWQRPKLCLRPAHLGGLKPTLVAMDTSARVATSCAAKMRRGSVRKSMMLPMAQEERRGGHRVSPE